MNDKPAGGAPLLTLRDVSLTIHGTPILQNINLSLEAGQTLGIIGESGSGKSMTALSVMQLLPRGAQLSGELAFKGQNLNTLHEQALCELRGGDIGMVFQEPMTALNPVKTIGDQVSESIRLHRRTGRSETESLTKETLDKVGLPPARFPLSRYPHELSGGQRQRVVIAIAVACRPAMLIADEPTTALDVTTQAGILALLKTLQEEEGLGLMLITHDLAVVSSMADDVLVMNQGQVVEQGALGAVFRQPKQAYTRELFEASSLSLLKARPASPDVHDIDQQQLQIAAASPTPVNVEASGDGLRETTTSEHNPTPYLGKHAAPLLQVDQLVCEYAVPQSVFLPAQYVFEPWIR